jgi:hypothetical protein
MAAFGESDTLEPWKLYRPVESAKTNPKAWWRYSILAERHKVRAFQRAELWRLAGNKGMNLLSHLRVLLAGNGSEDGVDLSGLSDTYLNDTAGKLKALETVVDDLNRENMTLRKLLKSLLTPLAKENLSNDHLTLQYIESQVTRFDENEKLDSTAKYLSPTNLSPRSKGASPTRVLDGSSTSCERDAEDVKIIAAISTIDASDVNLRSPYEKVLPPIALTEKDLREPLPVSKRGKPASLRRPKIKPVNPKDKFPSYLEREAMRKEAAAQKRNERILVSL